MIYDFYFTFSGQVPTDVPDTLGDLPRASSSSVDPAAAADDPGAGDDVLGDIEQAAAVAATASTPKGKRKRPSSTRDEDDWVDDFKATMAKHMSVLEKILAEKRRPPTKKDPFINYVTEYLHAADGLEYERMKYGIMQLMHYGPAASTPPAGPSGSQQYQPGGTAHYQGYYGQAGPAAPAGPSMWTSTQPQQPPPPPALPPPATGHFTSPSKRISHKSIGKLLESIQDYGWSDDV